MLAAISSSYIYINVKLKAYRVAILLLCSLVFSYYRFAETFDLNVQDPVAHKHTPYVIILIKVTEEWAKSHGDILPSTREEKREFKVYMVPNLYFRFLLLFINVI